MSPINGLIHGDQEDQFDGNQVWMKGMKIRGQVSLDPTTPSVNGCLIRITAIKTKDQGSGFQSSFVAYGSTSTINTNPAQTSPDVNPRLFDAAGNAQFTGNGYTVPFDRTLVTTLKSWTYLVNPGADQEAGVSSLPTPISCYLPINRRLQIEDPAQTGFTSGSRRFKHVSYYFVLQVICTHTGSVTDDVVNGNFRTEVYYRDI